MDQIRLGSTTTRDTSRPAAPISPRTPWAQPGAQLPTRGSVSLDVVAAHLQALCADGQAVAVARGVLAHDGDGRHRVVTAVLVVSPEDARATAAHVPLADLSLVGAPLSPAALADGASLVDALASAWAAGEGLRQAMRRSPAPDTAPGRPPSGYITRA